MCPLLLSHLDTIHSDNGYQFEENILTLNVSNIRSQNEKDVQQTSGRNVFQSLAKLCHVTVSLISDLMTCKLR